MSDRAIDAVTLARLRETYAGFDSMLEESSGLEQLIAAVTRTSRFLTRLLLADSASIDVLRSINERPQLSRENERLLVQWKRLELLRIAARDLTGLDQLEAVGANLSQLADDVLAGALELSGIQANVAIIGMGKLGGRELNYASDVDIMFVGDGNSSEREVRRALEIARNCFRVDAALRPEGRDGPLVRTLDSYQTYWEQWAQAWEFQALLKQRPVAGPEELRSAWRQAADAALWSHRFDADDLRSLREMKSRAELLLAKRGLTEREVKRGRGGIRDVEFAVQILQLVHGRMDESIRSPTTLLALDQLADGGYITRDDATSLQSSYRWLRELEHRLQLVNEEQTHTVPVDRESRSQLATSMGYVPSEGRAAIDQFENDLRTMQASVRSAHERLYFRPLLEAFADGRIDNQVDNERVEERLSAIGFTEANRTREAVAELTRGLARGSRLMQQMMPLLLDWLSASPDPDSGLLGLRTLMAGFRTPQHMVSIFRDSPEAARRLCLLLGTSRLYATGFSIHPEVLSDLGRDDALLPSVSYIDRCNAALQWRTNDEDRMPALRRIMQAEQLRIFCADAVGVTDNPRMARQRGALAEAVLQLTLDSIGTSLPMAIIGMGRFGGNEMSYASDLDLIVVHDGKTVDDQIEAERIAQQLLHLIGNPSPAKRLYFVDYDLRPEGKQGVLARSIDSCREYYAQWAQTWERQALVRARPVAGDMSTAKTFMEAIHGFVWDKPLTDAEVREIRHLKARMERERVPRGEDPNFNLKLGRGSLSDVEWTAQFLQLRHHMPGQNTLESLDALHNAGALSDEERQILRTAWSFCDRARNRWFLVNGEAADSLPSNAQRLTHLARSLDMTAPELRERYRQVTRRSRTVMEKLFYGKNDEG